MSSKILIFIILLSLKCRWGMVGGHFWKRAAMDDGISEDWGRGEGLPVSF